MDASNIGESVKDILYRTSQGLQGKGRTSDEELVRCGEQIADAVQNDDFLISTQQNGRPLQGHKNPGIVRQCERVLRIYDLKTRISRLDMVRYCTEQSVPLIPTVSYLSIQKLEKTLQEKNAEEGVVRNQLDKLLAGLGISLHDIDAIKKEPNASKLYSQEESLSEKTCIARKDLERAKNRAVLVFTGLDESQVHFYGNKPGDAPNDYVANAKPLGRKNIGEELLYAFTHFLESNPDGAEGEDLGPNNVPFAIEGRNNLYFVKLFDGQKNLVLQSLTFSDIRSLTN